MGSGNPHRTFLTAPRCAILKDGHNNYFKAADVRPFDVCLET